jgi:tape measure domain-containing protein
MATVLKAGSIKIDLEANAKNLISGFKNALKSLNSFEKKTEKTTSSSKKLKDQLKSLQRRKELLTTRMADLDSAGKKNSNMYQNVANQLANVNDRIETQNIRITEHGNKIRKSTGLLGGFQTALSNLGKTGQNAMKGLFDSITRIGEIAIGNVLANAISRATTMLVNFGKATFGLTVDLQDTRGGFEAMLGSAEKAQKLLVGLSEYNKKTPFQLPQLQEQASNLLAVGVSADELIPTLDTLGKISRGNANRMGFLTLAYGQVQTATKLTGAELRQFTENGVPLLEILAKQTGKSTSAMREAITEGEVSFEMVQKALQSTVQEGGRFYNYFEGQSKNFSFVSSNIMDNIQQIGRSIMGISESGDIIDGSLFDLITQGAQKLLSFIEQNKVAIQTFATGVLTQLTNALIFLANDILPRVFAKFQELQAWWQSESGQAVQDFLSNTVDVIADGFNILINDVIPALLDVVSEIPAKFKEVTEWYNDNKSWVDNFAILLGGIATGFGLVATALGIYTIVTGIATAVTGAFGIVMAVVTSPLFLIALAIGAVIAIGLLLWKNWDWIKEQALVIWGAIVGFFQSAIANIINFYTSFWDWLLVSPQEWGYRIGFLIGSIVAYFIDRWNFLMHISKVVWDTIKLWAIKALVGLINFIISFPGTVRRLFDQAKQWAVDAFNRIADWAKNKFDEVKDTVSKTFDEIKNIDLYQIGKDIIQGLIDGIKNMSGAVTDTVKGIAGGITDGFKNAMQIQSPSRVMFEAGVDTGKGIELGLESTEPAIETQIDRISNILIKSTGAETQPRTQTPNKNTNIYNYIQGTPKLSFYKNFQIV